MIRQVQAPTTCGELVTYWRHVRAGVPYREIDPACRAAMAAYQAEWSQARKKLMAEKRRREGRPPRCHREDPVVVPPSRPVDLVLAAAGCAGNGMSLGETAAVLGVSLDRVRSLISASRVRGGAS